MSFKLGEKVKWGSNIVTFGCVNPLCDQRSCVVFDEVGDYHGCCIDELQEVLNGEDNKPQQDKGLVSKYKYTPLEVESIFELKEPLEEGKLFYGKPDNMKKILNEWGLMKVIVEDEFRIHLLEEVNWQEQLCEEWSDFTTKSESIHYKGSMAKEDMILFAKRVLELSGELK